ncbi:zinc finger protein 765-like [Thrips palmi]|uniref:Zinc finger protein 765-like n=1 Tax=Thrips palmi TaxID=161013 RepID=A0A6P8Z106_THRPL|nr:zinc finger protein 765-like [Thrips palmi]XP_034246148.1 zinc finger protein 765-like [Thrips palmi]XP_034246158.1 zinc finger protein 765-like [Thrips palmi]
MDQQLQQQHEQQCAGVSENYISPAWLCTPHIKVESDVDVYRCQTSLYDLNNSHPTNCVPQSNSTYVNGPTMNCSPNDCGTNKILSVGHDSSTYHEQNNLSTAQQPAIQGFGNNQESEERMKLKNQGNVEYHRKQAFDLTCRSKSPSKEEESSSSDSQLTVDETLNVEGQTRFSTKTTCEICGKVLSSLSSYYVHMKVHSGNKPYACTYCEATFCRKPYLEVHMRTHTGERPFACVTCNKRFSQKSSLNTHKRVHTGERPYSCDICQKTFAVKSYVTAHRWTHISEKPLDCQHCDLKFTSKNLFNLHIRTHIDQNHECNICGRTFMKDSYLIRHQNKVHREPNFQTHINQDHLVCPPETDPT